MDRYTYRYLCMYGITTPCYTFAVARLSFNAKEATGAGTVAPEEEPGMQGSVEAATAGFCHTVSLRVEGFLGF